MGNAQALIPKTQDWFVEQLFLHAPQGTLSWMKGIDGNVSNNRARQYYLPDLNSMIVEEYLDDRTNKISYRFWFRGCEHNFEYKYISNALHEATCTKCGYRKRVDSSD